MARFALSFLGPVLITRDGCSLGTSLWAKPIALLAYLSLEADRPHRREALAALLWPEQPDPMARNSLRQALYQLHQALGGELLHVTAQSVQFRTGQGVVVDVAAFETLLQECRQHPHLRQDGCPACVERLERAAALYRGDLLAELAIKDSIEFEEWAMLRREQLQRQAVESLDTLAAHYARRGDYARMEWAGRRQIELDPLRERAHRQLLQALAWSGQPNAARAHYAGLVELLDRELGASPEETTAALVEQLFDGTLPPPASAALRQWPAPLTPLLGREEELAQLSEWLQAPMRRLITIVGTGGVGKTHLALEAAAREAIAFADGAGFVSLAPVANPDLIVPAVAAALRIPLAGSSTPPEQLAEALRDRDLLLVLDNCEHLLEGLSFITGLLAACPGLEVLATSREPLRLRAEQLFPLEPLALPALSPEGGAAAPVEAIARSAAVALFCQRARAVRPRFSLDAQNAPAVANICCRLDGLPLAIELTAAWMQTLSPAQILARLKKRLALLVDGARDLPPRQRTLRATLDWSYDLLTEGEKRLLARLAVLAGGGAQAAVRAICLGGEGDADGPDLADVSGLLKKNLLKCRDSAGQPRYVLLETIREYAQERLVERGESEAVQQRHARYYLDLAEEEGSKLLPSRQPAAVELLEVEHNNLRAALRWALEHRAVEVVLRLVSTLWRFWHPGSHCQEGLYWIKAALQLPLPGDRHALERLIPYRIEALTGAGAICCFLHRDLDLAISCLEEAATLARRTAPTTALPRILAWLGRAADLAGEPDQALRAYEEGLALARAAGPERRPTVAFIRNATGNILRDRGDYAGARTHYEEALALWNECGDSHGAVCASCNLAGALYLGGDPARAQDIFRQSLRSAREGKDIGHAAYSLFGLAAVAQSQGKSDLAAQLLGQSEALYRSLGMSAVPFDQPWYDSTVEALRTTLGERAFGRARAAGAGMEPDAAIALAMGEDA